MQEKRKKQQDARGDNKKGWDRCIEASKEVERLWRQRWNSESSITAFTWQWWSLVGEWGEIKAGSTQLRIFWIIEQLQFRNHISQSNFGFEFLACKTQFLSISEGFRNIAKYTQRMKAVKKAVFWWQKWCRNPVREEIFKKCTEYNLAENSSHISSDLHSDAALFKLSRPSNWKYCPLFKVNFFRCQFDVTWQKHRNIC